MGVLRGVTVAIVALVGVVIGVALFLVIGLFAVTPPTISQAAPGQDWDVTIEISDAFLSAQMNRSDSGADQPVQLSNAKAAAHADGTLTITGNVGGSSGGGAAPSSGARLPINTSAISVPVEIVMKPTAGQDGKLTVEIVKAQFGPLPVPSQVGKLLESPVNSQIAKAMNNEPFFITKITLRDGVMVIQARQIAK